MTSPYNMSFVDTSNTLQAMFVGLNQYVTGGLFAIMIIIVLAIILFTAYNSVGEKANLIITTFVLSVLSLLFYALKVIHITIAVALLLVFVGFIFYTMLTQD